ncbi:TPA: nucleotidyltransferase family protein [Providencia rettgeri]
MNHVLIYSKELTLKEVVKSLDLGGIGFVSFVDKDSTLVGILTDGDLRRGILNNQNNIDDFINFNPIKMNISTPRSEILSKLKQLHRRHMPLVDDNNKLISILTLDDIDTISKPNHVIIMAGGLGSRLGELTKDTPKPMLHVGNKPILHHLIEQFREQGFHKFILCLNYKKELIQEYFGNGEKFSVQIDYITEDKRMGTAGALSLINKPIEHPFFVINADVLTNMDFDDFLQFYLHSESTAAMAVRTYEHSIPFGVINSNKKNHIISMEEKPNITFNVNTGIYILEPSVISIVPKNKFFDMPSLFEALIKSGKICSCYKLDDYWIDIGRKEELIKANEDMTLNF